MPPLGLLLRCMLIVTFCLEGSLSLWASSVMALNHAHHVAATDQSRAAMIDQDCEDDASHDEGDAAHHDCDCSAGSGCTCACVLPVVAIAQTLLFAAPQVLATQLVIPSRPPVGLTATTGVFRPPIG